MIDRIKGISWDMKLLHWKPDKNFVIHRDHHIWFGEYNYRLSTEDRHTTGSLLL